MWFLKSNTQAGLKLQVCACNCFKLTQHICKMDILQKVSPLWHVAPNNIVLRWRIDGCSEYSFIRRLIVTWERSPGESRLQLWGNKPPGKDDGILSITLMLCLEILLKCRKTLRTMNVIQSYIVFNILLDIIIGIRYCYITASLA